MKKNLLFLAAMGMCINLFAGNLKPIAQKIDAQKAMLASLTGTELFAISHAANQKSIQMNAVVSNATVLEFSEREAQSILIAKPENLKFTIPIMSGGSLELELFRSDFFTPDFTVVTSATNGQRVPYSGGLHYWGIIKGDNNSLAAISIFNDEVMGMISSPAIGNLVLGKIENDSQSRHILYNDKDLHATDVPHCDTPEDGGGYGKDILPHGNQTQSVNCIRLYWEVNYDIFTGKGSVTAATNYVTSVFNQSAIIYTNDNIPVSLSQVFVWNTTSPYSGPSTSDYLNQFQSNVNSFNGDLGHLLGYAGGGGIAASTNGLCNSNTDYKQCYSGISSSYQNVPTYSWTVEVITHEQGHLMGSRHTHDCAWNGNNTKIDSCGDYAGYASGTCSVGGGNQALPSGGGTIMSYCHLVGSVGINFSNGFGSQPKTAILNKYNAASCLTACTGSTCNAPTAMTTGSITQSSAVFSWTAATGAVSYNVHYRIIGAGSWTTGTTATTTFTASPLTAGSNYEWQVQTVCSAGSSSYTSSTNFSTLAAACNAPSSMTTGNITQTSALFAWTAANGAVSYNIRYRIIGAANWTTGTSATTSFTASPLTAGSNYEWQVQTVCSAGPSSFTASTNFTTINITSCGAPSGLTTTNITGVSATLNWNSILCDSFLVRYYVTAFPNSVYFKKVTPGSAVNTTITGLSSSTNYSWLVRTYCNGGQSGLYSSTATFTTIASNCGVPSGLTSASVTGSSAMLIWTAVNGASGYNIRYRINGTSVWTNRTSNTTSISITGLTGGSIYEWQVQSICTAGTSAFTNSSVFTTLIVCNVPSGLFVSGITSTSATLNWSTVSCDSFLVRYYKTSAPNTVYFKIVAPGAATATTITGLVSGAAYSWLIRTYCNNGQSGAYSVTNTFTSMSPSPQGGENGNSGKDYATTQPLIIYPNPANENVTIEFSAIENGKSSLHVFNLMGQLVLSNILSGKEGLNVMNVNTSSLGEGVYYFELGNNEGLQRRRVLISR